jgi:hypothetical protein
MLKALKFLPQIIAVIDLIGSATHGEEVSNSTPVSIKGHRGILTVSWKPSAAPSP